MTCAIIAFCFFGVRPRDLTDDFYKALRAVIEENDGVEYVGKTAEELADEIPDLFTVDDPFMTTTRTLKMIFFAVMVAGVWAGYVSAYLQHQEEQSDEDMRPTEILQEGGDKIMGRWVALFTRFRAFLRSAVKRLKVPEDEARLSPLYISLCRVIIALYIVLCAVEIGLEVANPHR